MIIRTIGNLHLVTAGRLPSTTAAAPVPLSLQVPSSTRTSRIPGRAPAGSVKCVVLWRSIAPKRTHEYTPLVANSMVLNGLPGPLPDSRQIACRSKYRPRTINARSSGPFLGLCRNGLGTSDGRRRQGGTRRRSLVIRLTVASAAIADRPTAVQHTAQQVTGAFHVAAWRRFATVFTTLGP
jgi:hypothetical protein